MTSERGPDAGHRGQGSEGVDDRGVRVWGGVPRDSAGELQAVVGPVAGIEPAGAIADGSETTFVDAGHITPIGNAAVADAMLPWILDTAARTSGSVP